MRFHGGRAAALTAVVLLAAGACTSKPSKDDELSLDNSAVRLTTPQLQVTPSGAWALSASFAWDFCGERACFALEDSRHGGPDVFGVFLEHGPPLARRFGGEGGGLVFQSDPHPCPLPHGERGKFIANSPA